MASQDNLSPAQFPRLFHGSKDEMAPGTVIRPADPESLGKLGYAFATRDVGTARVFAGGSKNIKAGAGHVYEVEPVDPSDVAEQQMHHTGREVHFEHSSKAGFRVVRKLSKTSAIRGLR